MKSNRLQFIKILLVFIFAIFINLNAQQSGTYTFGSSSDYGSIPSVFKGIPSQSEIGSNNVQITAEDHKGEIETQYKKE